MYETLLCAQKIHQFFLSIQRSETCLGEKRERHFEDLIGEQLKAVMAQSRECFYDEQNNFFVRFFHEKDDTESLCDCH